jgi:hypothetical protein
LSMPFRFPTFLRSGLQLKLAYSVEIQREIPQIARSIMPRS